MRDRIVAFAKAVGPATAKIATVATSSSAGSSVVNAKQKTLKPVSRVVGAEERWASARLSDTPTSASRCPLFVVWWNTAGGGDRAQFEDWEFHTREMKPTSMYANALFNVRFGLGQRKLDKAIVRLKALNKRVAALAEAVEAAPDPCAIDRLP